jgi:hypothetical protein
VYLDTLQKPYAVFRFRYRERGVLMGGAGEIMGKRKRELGKREERGEVGECGGGEALARELTERWVLGTR